MKLMHRVKYAQIIICKKIEIKRDNNKLHHELNNHDRIEHLYVLVRNHILLN